MKSGLKFLTLNCWGLPFLTPFKNRRLDAITEIIRNGKWDVVALQEVWLKSDRDRIIQKACFPYHTTFAPAPKLFGTGGGGLLLLSRFKILKSEFHPFVVKGFPHRLHEGDFHASKGIGYALLDTPMGEMPVFATHLIANYARRHEIDLNRVFRMAQILELVFYIRRKATPRGFVLAGDLNATEADLELETLFALTGVNKTTRPQLKSFRRRLDHVICGASQNELEYHVASGSLVMRKTFGEEKIPYSDHEAVSAVIKPRKAVVGAPPSKRILERTLRYMTYSMQSVKKLNDWVRVLPVVGPISSQFMSPQFTYIEALLNMLETDLKLVQSEHPLRLKEIV